MELKLRTRAVVAELEISTGGVKMTEDIAIIKNGSGYIPDEIVEEFITLAVEMHRYNGHSDVDFAKIIFDNFLSDGERVHFMEIIQ